VIVLSEYEPTRTPLLDGALLAKSLQGLAHVALVPAELTYALSDTFGKRLSCFLGAARLYNPGFGRDADPYAHRLLLAETIADDVKMAAAHKWLRTECARLSVARLRARRDEASFAAIRRESLAERARGFAARGDLTAQLAAERERIEALERELSDAKELERLAIEGNHALEQRAEEAERQARSAVHRVQALLASRSATGGATVAEATLPTTWTDFLPWVEEQLAGQVVLAPKARRQVSGSPEYQDVETAARCLVWLAETYRSARLGGGHPALRDAVIVEGIRNARCGADSFSIRHGDRKIDIDWHIKTGSNIRDWRFALRIYYGWDEESAQVIIAEMPAHISTGAS
jgi:hypothetical protein